MNIFIGLGIATITSFGLYVIYERNLSSYNKSDRKIVPINPITPRVILYNRIKNDNNIKQCLQQKKNYLQVPTLDQQHNILVSNQSNNQNINQSNNPCPQCKLCNQCQNLQIHTPIPVRKTPTPYQSFAILQLKQLSSTRPPLVPSIKMTNQLYTYIGDQQHMNILEDRLCVTPVAEKQQTPVRGAVNPVVTIPTQSEVYPTSVESKEKTNTHVINAEEMPTHQLDQERARTPTQATRYISLEQSVIHLSNCEYEEHDINHHPTMLIAKLQNDNDSEC